MNKKELINIMKLHIHYYTFSYTIIDTPFLITNVPLNPLTNLLCWSIFEIPFLLWLQFIIKYSYHANILNGRLWTSKWFIWQLYQCFIHNVCMCVIFDGHFLAYREEMFSECCTIKYIIYYKHYIFKVTVNLLHSLLCLFIRKCFICSIIINV